MTAARPRRQTGRAFPIVIAVVALAAMVAGVWLSARFSQLQGTPAARSAQTDQTPTLQSGTLLAPPKPLPAFEFQDQHHEAVDAQRLRGHWTLLFFGYSHCPDVCPNTLAVLNLTLNALPEQLREQTQVLFVSVDPQRDTAAQLGRYVSYFNPKFIGARGSVEQLDKLTRALGVLYVHNAPDQNGDYTVDHSAAVLVIDPQAELAALFSNLPHDPAQMAQDLGTIRDYHKDQP